MVQIGQFYCPNTSNIDLLIICKSSSLQWKRHTSQFKFVHDILQQAKDSKNVENTSYINQMKKTTQFCFTDLAWTGGSDTRTTGIDCRKQKHWSVMEVVRRESDGFKEVTDIMLWLTQETSAPMNSNTPGSSGSLSMAYKQQMRINKFMRWRWKEQNMRNHWHGWKFHVLCDYLVSHLSK